MMNLDELKHDWAMRNKRLADDRFDELARRVVSHAANFESKIKRRDWIEAGAAAIVFVWFGYVLLSDWMPPRGKWAVVLVLIAVVEAIAVMFWTRRSDALPDPDLPLADYCKMELARVDRQIRLGRNVTWWYSGPMMLACCVFFYAVLSSLPGLPPSLFIGLLVCFCAIPFVIVVFIYRLNRRGVDRDLVPLRDEISNVIRSLEED